MSLSSNVYGKGGFRNITGIGLCQLVEAPLKYLSARGQLLAEYTQGYPVRTFTYNGAGHLVRATVFTLTTEFVYNGLGARVAVSVAGQTTRYALDYAQGHRILAERTPTGTVTYLYGRECLGEWRGADVLYYLHDATGHVRQGTDASGAVVSTWLFDPDGTLLEGPEGPVSHLICGGVYDGSTGLIYKGGRYFDPTLGIWLALLPLVVVQGWRNKKRRGGHPWALLLCVGLFGVGVLAGCGGGSGITTTCTTIPITPTPDKCRDCDALPTSNGELKYQPGLWNDDGRILETNNCYSYAAHDLRIRHPDFGLPLPGGVPLIPITSSGIRAMILSDGFEEHDCETACSSDKYKVMAFISKTPAPVGDVHFYRQDADGCWSHKPGGEKVTNLDAKNQEIGDPRCSCIDRTYGKANYDEFVGCFCVRAGTETRQYIPGAPSP